MSYQNKTMINTIAEYQIESRKFAIYPDMGSNMWYPCLGLIEEMDEWANAIEGQQHHEAGDLAWYIAQICTEIGYDLQLVEDAAMIGFDAWQERWGYIYISDGFTAKTAKKWHRDGESEKRRNDLISICEYFWLEIFQGPEAEYWPRFGCPDLLSVLDANLSKLQDRADRGVIKGDGDHR